MAKPLIYLASQSPRRRELLLQIGVQHHVLKVDIDEAPREGEAPEVYVLRMALEKARGGVTALGSRSPLPVLGSDTSVVIDGEILGKPRDEAHGLAMLERLSGRSHQVLTSVALVVPDREEGEATRLSVSHVRFRATTAGERQAYWASGEPIDKAGAYGIQGMAATFIEHLEGSFSGVMGLPLFETAELLRLFDLDVTAAWQNKNQ